jgi:hypothetical protein
MLKVICKRRWLSKTSENRGGAVVLPRHRLVVALVALAILTDAEQAATVPSTIDAGMVGPPFSNARAELFLPEGSGPFPAMVLLHGCGGVVPHDRVWAQQLVAWGYVAMLVDSFRPRGVDNVCNHGMIVPPRVQAQGAFAAAAYLRGLRTVRADRGRCHRLLARRLGGLESGARRCRARRPRPAFRRRGRVLSRLRSAGLDALSYRPGMMCG